MMSRQIVCSAFINLKSVQGDCDNAGKSTSGDALPTAEQGWKEPNVKFERVFFFFFINQTHTYIYFDNITQIEPPPKVEFRIFHKLEMDDTT